LTSTAHRVKVLLLGGNVTMSDELPFQAGKFLIIAGVVLVAVGLLLMAGSKFSLFGLGRLPGDIAYKGKHLTFFFPIVTSIVLSVVLTLVLWLVSLWTRR
jgi:uncharacterized membrane protein